MTRFELGKLSGVPAGDRLDLLAERTRNMLTASGFLEEVGVVEIDPALSDTAVTQKEFALLPETLANCVILGGSRDGNERLAACVVLANTRVDVNGLVRRLLNVRKASFLPVERAVELTGMEYGGISPIGLPDGWPVLIDRRVIVAGRIVSGSGLRRSKILLDGALLARLPGAEVIEGLSVG